MSEYYQDPNTGRREKKQYITPVWKQSRLSPYEWNRQPAIIKEIFHKCPNCSNYSLKPDYNMSLLKNKNEVYSIATKKGRKCQVCKYTLAGSPLYD